MTTQFQGSIFLLLFFFFFTTGQVCRDRSSAPKSSYRARSIVSCVLPRCCRHAPWPYCVRQSFLSCAFAYRARLASTHQPYCARSTVATWEIPCPRILCHYVRRTLSRQHGCEKSVATEKSLSRHNNRVKFVAIENSLSRQNSSVARASVDPLTPALSCTAKFYVAANFFATQIFSITT